MINKCSYVISVALIVTIFCSCGNLRTEDTKNTGTIQNFTDAELDDLESKLKNDPNCRWKLLSVDRKKLIPLLLAAQERNPTYINFIWCHLIDMCFAEDQFQARRLPAEQRRARYKCALGYLRKSSQILQTALEVNPDKSDKKALKGRVSSLNVRIALASLETGDIASAKRLAEEIVKRSPSHHLARTVLGRVALRENDLEAAKIHLLKSVTIGSDNPSLRSFGPSFILARELLEKGEKSAVLEYLDVVQTFWADVNDPRRQSNPNSLRVAQDHAKKLTKWKNEIMKGNIPQDNQWR